MLFCFNLGILIEETEIQRDLVIGIGTDPESEIGIGTEIGTDDTEMTNTSHGGNSRLVIYILLYSDLHSTPFMNVIHIMFCFEWFNTCTCFKH